MGREEAALHFLTYFPLYLVQFFILLFSVLQTRPGGCIARIYPCKVSKRRHYGRGNSIVRYHFLTLSSDASRY